MPRKSKKTEKEVDEIVCASGFKLPANWKEVNYEIMNSYDGPYFTEEICRGLFAKMVRRCGGTDADAAELWAAS